MEEYLELPSHFCASCGTSLWDSKWPYAYCENCTETKKCPHGVLFKESCSK